MNGNVVKSEAEALMCVIISKTEQHVPYGELVLCNVINEVSHKSRLL